MRLLPFDEARPGPGDTLFRERGFFFTGLGLMATFWAGGVWMVLSGSGMPVLFTTALAGAPAYFVLRWALPSFRRDSWTMAVGPDRLLLRPRPAGLRARGAPPPLVIEIPLAEIASLQVTCLTVTHTSRTQEYDTEHPHLDLRLPGMSERELHELRTHLRRERELGKKAVAARFLVSATPSGVRVDWTGGMAMLKPSVEEAVRLLAAAGVAVEPEARHAVHSHRPEQAAPEAAEWYVRSLASSGETWKAAGIAHKLYGGKREDAERNLEAWLDR